MTVTNHTQVAPNSAIKFDITSLTEIVGDGRIFSATFTKKNGETRHILARTGVHKGLTGTGLTYDPAERGLLSVWDIQNEGYRYITAAAVTQVKAHGQTFTAGGAA